MELVRRRFGYQTIALARKWIAALIKYALRSKGGIVPLACHLAQPVVCIIGHAFSQSNQEAKDKFAIQAAERYSRSY